MAPTIQKVMGGITITREKPQFCEPTVFFIPEHEIRDTILSMIKAYGNFPPQEAPTGLIPTNQEA